MTNLEDVHRVFKKCLYLESTNFIDVLLTTYLTKDLEDGERLWMFPVKPSGWGATTQLEPFARLARDEKYNILLLDQVNTNAFASGIKGKDLGARLNDKKTLIIVPDLASIMSMDPENAKSLFAMWRTMYDGYIVKYTGKGDKLYKNIRVNMFACSTPIIRTNIEFSSQMGTRELLYDLDALEHPKRMMNVSLSVADKDEMFCVVRDFIDEHKGMSFKPAKLPGGYDLGMVADNIAVWRCDGNIDVHRGELIDNVSKEMPARLYKQLDKLCSGLTSIGVGPYEVQKILIEIVNGVGSRIRKQIYRKLYELDAFGMRVPIPLGKTHYELANIINKSPNVVKGQLMILKDLGVVVSDGPLFTGSNEKCKWMAESLKLLDYY